MKGPCGHGQLAMGGGGGPGGGVRHPGSPAQDRRRARQPPWCSSGPGIPGLRPALSTWHRRRSARRLHRRRPRRWWRRHREYQSVRELRERPPLLLLLLADEDGDGELLLLGELGRHLVGLATVGGLKIVVDDMVPCRLCHRGSPGHCIFGRRPRGDARAGEGRH
jgi:hypothetical protein